MSQSSPVRCTTLAMRSTSSPVLWTAALGSTQSGALSTTRWASRRATTSSGRSRTCAALSSGTSCTRRAKSGASTSSTATIGSSARPSASCRPWAGSASSRCTRRRRAVAATWPMAARAPASAPLRATLATRPSGSSPCPVCSRKRCARTTVSTAAKWRSSTMASTQSPSSTWSGRMIGPATQSATRVSTSWRPCSFSLAAWRCRRGPTCCWMRSPWCSRPAATRSSSSSATAT
mmetsp:Transcript_32188/g.63869  ORF Transcript_32188/g.63869 Transcript_32188/m.63869 type:complete len:234 (+) Transcript_32188:213-914(+)